MKKNTLISAVIVALPLWASAQSGTTNTTGSNSLGTPPAATPAPSTGLPPATSSPALSSDPSATTGLSGTAVGNAPASPTVVPPAPTGTTSAAGNQVQPHGYSSQPQAGALSGAQAGSLDSLGRSSISDAQRALSQRGYSLTADGVLGSQTTSAIRNFQTQQGLAQTGVLDAPTLRALNVTVPAARSPSSID